MDLRIADKYHICFALVMFASKSNVIFYCYCEERIEGKILHLLVLYISYTKYMEVNIFRNPNVADTHHAIMVPCIRCIKCFVFEQFCFLGRR